MDKVNLLEYVNLMNRYDEQAQLGMTLVFTEDDKNLMRYMRKLAMQDEEVRKFLNSINDLKPNERERAVYNYFNEPLEEENPKSNTRLVTLEDIKNHRDIISAMSKEESNKLNYLINNYKKLNIRYINLENLTYIDENNEEQTVSLEQLNPKVEDDILEDKTFVNDALSMVKKSNEEEQKIEKPVVQSQKKENQSKKGQSGYISALFLFMLTAFTGGILASIITFILSR